MNFTKNELLLGLGALAIFLALDGLYTYRHTLRLRTGQARVAQAYEVLGALQETLGIVTDAETGQRGYILTGDLGYLEPYRRASARIQVQLTRLERMVQDDPGLASRLPRLERLVAAKLGEMKQTIDLQRTSPARAHRMIETHLGRNLMHDIRSAITALTSEERARLLENEVETRQAYRVAVEASAAMAVLGLLLVAGLGVLVHVHLRDRAAFDRALERQQQWQRVTLSGIGDGLVATDAEGAVRFMNPRAEALTGWRAEEAEGRPLEEVVRRAPSPTSAGQADLAGATLLTARDGRVIHVDDSEAPILDAAGGPAGRVLVLHDATGKRRRQEEVQRLDRALRAVSKSSQALMRSASVDEPVYLAEICDIVTQDCGHAMVWIGFLEDGPERRVRPAAFAGFDEGYLGALRITAAEDDPHGLGPTGMCIRTGRPCLCRDTLADPVYEPWRAEARKRGYRSSLAIPLQSEGRAFGAVTFYSREPDGFSEGEVTLLEELTADLAYGITTNRLRAKHAIAEESLRESEERFRAAFENGVIPMILATLDGRPVRVNPSFRRMLGYSDADLEGLTVWDLTHPDDLAESRAGYERLARGECASFRMEKRYRCKSGAYIWGDMCTAYVPDAMNRPLYLVTHIQDITERKRAQQELQEASRRKDEFLATLAHELRNPLAPIRTGAFLLAGRGAADPETRRLYDLLNRQAAHMARLVDDLLDISRIERGKVELRREPVDLARVMGHVRDVCRTLLEGRGHTLVLDLPAGLPPLDADPARLEQMLTNLVNNACKYTPEGGRIQVSAAREGDLVAVRVRDNGIGLAPETQDRVFDLFYQAGRTLDNPEGGLGIGLTLVRRLAEQHGGSVTATSAGPGQGSEFVLRLPAQAESAPAASKPAPAATGNARHVLIIDDDPGVRTTSAMLLRSMGFQVTVAGSGEKGVERAHALRPAIALIDLAMPGMGGLEAAARIRADLGQDIRLVALTGYSREEDVAQSLAAGFDRHLVKSGDPMELVRVLQDI